MTYHYKPTRKTKTDRYTVDLSEMIGEYDSNELAEIAIREAEERTRIYATPATWESYETEEEGVYRVTRTRYA